VGIYVYIAVAMLVAGVLAYSVQPNEQLNGIAEMVLVAVIWPLYLAWYVLTVVFEYWVGEQEPRSRRHSSKNWRS
jgi:hypothetical protein